MSETAKDTIYIDMDDEITAIVDKIQASDSKIVALVLPKRASVLQSIVNMKLLKRASDEANKKVVLITSEAGLLPLAGATGLYVAKNLQSKPEIPESPDNPTDDGEEVVENMDDEESDMPVGKLAGAAAIGAVGASAIRRGDDEASAASGSSPTAKASKPPKSKKASTTKIPSFEKFRKKIFITAGVVALLIVFWILAVIVLPKATIAIVTNTETIDSSFEFNANSSASSVNVKTQTVPAQFASATKEDSATVAATEKKDVGTKAKGTVTIRNCSDSAVSIKSGTGVSSNSLTFIMQGAVSLTSGNFDSGGGCKTSGTHVGTVQVVAQNNGDQYNLSSGSTYTVSGFSSSVAGTGSAMTGGTSKTVTVVGQSDVDAAKAKLDTKEDKIKSDLTKELEDKGYFVVPNSLTKEDENTAVSPKVGEEASEVTVTYTAKFYLVGIKKEDLNKLIEDNIKDQINIDKQQIQNDGIDDATFKIIDTNFDDDSVELSIDTQVEVGPEIDTEALKTEIAGKKSGETENIVRGYPGVQEVQVKYSPFWVNKTPTNTSKITIVFKSSDTAE